MNMTRKFGWLQSRKYVLKRNHSQLSLQESTTVLTQFLPDLNNMVSAHHCANAVPNHSQLSLLSLLLVVECKHLKLKYNKEQIKRRKLHNQFEDIKVSGNMVNNG
ncbi:unnamed protein product [Lactuca saligna]|uniref:Uncharacterized protein n=1 Tax=Lactuca saligna TaxID=75948 RepID=A0AA35YHU4_LACSI|nr:unnamed protein product [Lactuca saligna]